MLQRVRADLHVHTCLSPCADLEMTPQKISAEAQRRGIQIVAICDHNSAENVAAVARAAGSTQVVVLPGMEVCSKEEIHVLAIFGDVESVYALQSIVYEHLPGRNDPDVFGLQVIANEMDEVVGFQDKLLIGAVDLSIDQIVDSIHRLGGVVIASHIDRESYSVVSQLGFVPKTLRFDAFELTAHVDDAEARKRFHFDENVPFVRNSDAHFLNDLGKNSSEYLLEHPDFREVRKAFANEGGRRVYTVH
jgi:PHP family Zn ribbon phosphoesterase